MRVTWGPGVSRGAAMKEDNVRGGGLGHGRLKDRFRVRTKES